MGSIIRSDVFIRAIERRDKQLLAKLLELGRVNSYRTHDSHGELTLLHIAAGLKKCPEWLIRKLLRNGANPNAVGADQMTPVHISAMWGRLSSLVALIEYGGDPNLKDAEGRTAFDLLLEFDHLDCHAALKRFLTDKVPDRLHSFDIEHNDVSTGTESVLNTAYVSPDLPMRRQKPRPDHDFTATDTSYASTRSPGSCTLDSYSSDDLQKLTNAEIAEELKAVGEDSPPVTEFTRNLYLHKLAHLKLGDAATVKLGSQNSGVDNSHCQEQCCEVLHYDPDRRVVLREVHYPSASDTESCASATTEPVVAVPPELEKLTNEQLFTKLRELGDDPGPVTGHTRLPYLRRLVRVTTGQVSLMQARSVLPPDIHFAIANPKQLLSSQALEREMELGFQGSNQTWREGNHKTCFNYLLLDSRVTQNLPLRAPALQMPEMMSAFVRATFYIGKGKRSRPYSHLTEALSASKGPAWEKQSAKVKKIQQIWSDGHGVVSLHMFQNILPVEAYTREACMIEALGINRLTNEKRGDCYGTVKSWPAKKRKKLGAYLIYKALNIFLSEGERHLGPLDF